MNIIKTRYYELLNSDPILLVHAIFDFIVIVAICKVGDRPLPGTVLPMPEITISPPLRFLAHSAGGKQAGRI